MSQYAHLSTTRLAQLTGDYDPAGLAHFNTTGVWGVEGVDLGANTEHEGRLFIFFGDVPLTQPGRAGPPYDADFIAYIENSEMLPGSSLAAARQGRNQLDVFFIGADGGLYVTWVIDGGVWQGPVLIAPASVAPKGASLTAARQLDNQLDVFFVGADGGLYVSWVIDGGAWQGPVRITPANVAPQGAGLAAAKQRDNQLNVFFIGTDGGLHVSSVIEGGVWQGPVLITPANIAPPGASLAAVKQLDKQLDVFFTGAGGGLYVSWVIDGGAWQGPVLIAPADVAPPGASLTAAKQRDNQLDVFFIGAHGGLYVSWVIDSGTWQGPVLIAPADIAPPGASLAAARQLENQLDVFFIGANGGLYVSWVMDGGSWQGPVLITPADIAPQGASLAAAKQLGNQLDVFLIGTDKGLYVSSVIDGGGWQDRVRILPVPFRLTPVLKDGLFYPFSVRTGDDIWMTLTNEGPTGAFSYANRAYVFVVAGGARPVSWLTSSSDPRQPKPYVSHFKLSDAAQAGSGRFYQVAPWVLKNAEIQGLPSGEGDGLIMFGHGWGSSGFGVHLAWMPLQPDRVPDRSDVRFYTGDPDPTQTWSSQEAKAKTLVTTRFGWTSLSVGRIPGTGYWILLNQKAGGIEDNKKENTWDAPIVARIAPTPWEISAAEEIPIFDPIREGARGRYMAPDSNTFPSNWPPRIGHPSFAYGAFLLNPYTQWDVEERIATITYLVSTGCPYQVQVMQSRILFVRN